MARLTRGGLLLTLALLAAGCCPTPARTAGGVDRRTLPPPISLTDQLSRLNDRAAALPRLRAETVLRGVELRYLDQKGQPHTENVEGTLLLKGANVILLGKAFDQQVFQAGRNATDWWFILRLDIKTARVGDARRPVDVGTPGDAPGGGGGGPGGGVLRADLVQDLLGLTPLGQAGGGSMTENELLVLRVDDFTGTNDLLVEAVAPGGRARIKRELRVDRRTGDIAEVRLYDAEGVMVVRSLLTDYRPVDYTGENNDAARDQAPAPRVPHHVGIDYPAQHLSLSLQFDRVTVPARINDAAFETPDFEAEGLKVIREQ